MEPLKSKPAHGTDHVEHGEETPTTLGERTPTSGASPDTSRPTSVGDAQVVRYPRSEGSEENADWDGQAGTEQMIDGEKLIILEFEEGDPENPMNVSSLNALSPDT